MAPTYCTINENSMLFLYQPRSLVDKCKSKSDRLCLRLHFIFSSVILSSQRWLLIGSNWHLFAIAPSGSWWLLLIVATEFLWFCIHQSVVRLKVLNQQGFVIAWQQHIFQMLPPVSTTRHLFYTQLLCNKLPSDRHWQENWSWKRCSNVENVDLDGEFLGNVVCKNINKT